MGSGSSIGRPSGVVVDVLTRIFAGIAMSVVLSATSVAISAKASSGQRPSGDGQPGIAYRHVVTGPAGSLTSRTAAKASGAEESVRRQPKWLRSDFNGDGVSDLAISGISLGRRGNARAVVLIVYGTVHGLRSAGNQRLRASSFGGNTVRSPSFEERIRSVAVGDFDDDGYGDLAISFLTLTTLPDREVGKVGVIYGSSRGLVAKRSQIWDQSVLGRLPGHRRSSGDSEGATLVAGDFGRGGADDLAVGESWRNGSRGTVTVLYGSSSGLRAVERQVWSQASRGVSGKAMALNRFGSALAAGDFGRSAHSDLAIGTPGDLSEDGLKHIAGVVDVLYGSGRGLTARGSQHWSQRTPGVLGKAHKGEGFGFSLAAGHFDGRRVADLAIGVVSDRHSGGDGAVNILYGSNRGLTVKNSQLWTATRSGLAGIRPSAGGFLGIRLAVGNFGRNHNGRVSDDLAFTGVYDDGQFVEVIYGSVDGLTARGSQNWQWNTPGVKGTGWSYGGAVAAADFGRSRYADLASSDSQYGSDAAGAVSVLYGSGAGLTAKDDQFWSASKLNRPRVSDLGDVLGAG